MMSDFAVLRDTLALEHYAERLPMLRERAKSLRQGLQGLIAANERHATEYKARLVAMGIQSHHKAKWSDEIYAAAFDLQDTLSEIANIEADIPRREQRLAAQQRKAS